MTSPSVRRAAALPDLIHRDPEFLRIVHDTKKRLLEVYGQTQEWVAYLLGGSGTAAVEAMVTSCVEKGPVLVVQDGYYSARIHDLLEIHQIPYESFELDWLEGWTQETLERLHRTLEQGFEALITTHNETTVGRLNPIGEIARHCKTHGTRVLIDAMSSFGADAIDFTHLDAVATSANKCLHGLPGVAIVLASPEFAQEIRRFPRRTYYLSLPMYEGDIPPLTAPVPSLRALHQALVENGGGQKARAVSYRQKLAMLRCELRTLGFSFAIPDEDSSCTLCCPKLPPGWTYDQWFEANYERGFVIYGCKGDLRDQYFQASVMGELTTEDIELWLRTVRSLL